MSSCVVRDHGVSSCSIPRRSRVPVDMRRLGAPLCARPLPMQSSQIGVECLAVPLTPRPVAMSRGSARQNRSGTTGTTAWSTPGRCRRRRCGQGSGAKLRLGRRGEPAAEEPPARVRLLGRRGEPAAERSFVLVAVLVAAESRRGPVAMARGGSPKVWI